MSGLWLTRPFDWPRVGLENMATSHRTKRTMERMKTRVEAVETLTTPESTSATRSTTVKVSLVVSRTILLFIAVNFDLIFDLLSTCISNMTSKQNPNSYILSKHVVYEWCKCYRLLQQMLLSITNY